MKRLILVTFLLSFVIFSSQAITPFYALGSVGADVELAKSNVKSALESGGFDVIGEYSPGGNPDWYVLVFSSDELQKLAIGLGERTGLAAALKLGLIKKDGHWELNVQNPRYLFNAVFRDEMENGLVKAAADRISEKVNGVFELLSSSKEAFGGDVSSTKLRKYHYMLGMPYFSDPVELNSFESFEQGLALIRENLKSGKGETSVVYEIIDEANKVAVFGVALNDPDIGEASFLPIVGASHLAAMPYEIILEGNDATCLHGRYRFALYWPELSMGTFTKIMSAPGNVATILKGLTD